MSEGAQERGWGHPDDKDFRKNNIVKVTAGGINLYLHREVAKLFEHFINTIVSRGYRVAGGTPDDWSYVNRDIRGRPGVKSNHAWGLAADLNATTNPMTNDNRVHTDMPSWVGRLAKTYGLRWGGDYEGSRRDPMHFEFMGTPKEAQALVRTFFPPTPAPQPPKPAPRPATSPAQKVSDRMPTLRRGDEGRKVRVLQALLNTDSSGTKIDGDFGPATEKAVKGFQKVHKLDQDGIVGRKTWDTLLGI